MLRADFLKRRKEFVLRYEAWSNLFLQIQGHNSMLSSMEDRRKKA